MASRSGGRPRFLVFSNYTTLCYTVAVQVQARLKNLKNKVMKKIAEAAQRQDTRLISLYGAIANSIEEDERSLGALQARIGNYEKDLNNPTLLSTPSWTISATEPKRGRGRQTGKQVRRKFVDSGASRGFHLTHLRGSLYQTPSRKKVVIAFASEQRQDRWLLGVPEGQYHVVVLLCQSSHGEMFEFILPDEALEKFWRSLSRHAGQVKVNMTKDGANWSLLVPGQGRESVNRYLGNYKPLED